MPFLVSLMANWVAPWTYFPSNIHDGIHKKNLLIKLVALLFFLEKKTSCTLEILLIASIKHNVSGNHKFINSLRTMERTKKKKSRKQKSCQTIICGTKINRQDVFELPPDNHAITSYFSAFEKFYLHTNCQNDPRIFLYSLRSLFLMKN